MLGLLRGGRGCAVCALREDAELWQRQVESASTFFTFG